MRQAACQSLTSLLHGCFCCLCVSTGVLDIAGGRGDLAHALSTEFGVDTTVIDPVQRPPRHASRRPAVSGAAASPGRVRQLVQPFDESFGQPCHSHDPVVEQGQMPQKQETETAEWLLENASVLVGLHPDQPTGDIVTVANSRHGARGPAPFAVVPCCVFSELFPERTIGDARPGRNDSAISGGLINVKDSTCTRSVLEAARPVRETHDLTVWLAERSLLAYDNAEANPCSVPQAQGQVRVCRLPFNGRNQVVYTVPGGMRACSSESKPGGQPDAKRSKTAGA